MNIGDLVPHLFTPFDHGKKILLLLMGFSIKSFHIFMGLLIRLSLYYVLQFLGDY
jgi:hypothetical protein